VCTASNRKDEATLSLLLISAAWHDNPNVTKEEKLSALYAARNRTSYEGWTKRTPVELSHFPESQTKFHIGGHGGHADAGCSL
jgi:hypothetical protein